MVGANGDTEAMGDGNEQVVHSPMGWGGVHGAPTQPATVDAETVVEASNQYTVHETVTVGEGNVVEQTVHSNSNEQVVHSPMGWG